MEKLVAASNVHFMYNIQVIIEQCSVGTKLKAFVKKYRLGSAWAVLAG